MVSLIHYCVTTNLLARSLIHSLTYALNHACTHACVIKHLALIFTPTLSLQLDAKKKYGMAGKMMMIAKIAMSRLSSDVQEG